MTKKSTKHEFQAETKQVLDIVVNSLYKDKEIFIRVDFKCFRRTRKTSAYN